MRLQDKSNGRTNWYKSLLGLGLMGLLVVPSLALSRGYAQGPEITVYNQNFGLVKDYRTLDISKGTKEVQLDDVAALIDPTSVHFKSLTAPKEVHVLEQNFRYDLINRTNILNKMVGRSIRFKKDGQIKSGTLLNPASTWIMSSGYSMSPYSRNVQDAQSDSFAIQTTEGVLLTTLDDILIDALPPGLSPRPLLAFLLNAEKGGQQDTELSYLTDGLNWFADYVAVYNDKTNALDLTGWVTLDNRSGATYDDAQLKLVAGDVRKIQNQPRAEMDYARGMAMKVQAMAAPFQEEGLFEYHLYTLGRRTTLRNNETKQLTLIEANNIPVTRTYVYDPQTARPFEHYNRQPGQGSATSTPQKIATLVKLENKKTNNLGMPLPKGRVRVNMADSNGSLQFVGEDQIDHTPEDETISLYLGDAFDLVGERKQTHYEQNGSTTLTSYEVALRNHKSQPVSIRVVDHAYGEWEVRNASVPFTKIDSQTLEAIVEVPAKGSKTITYTIRVSQR